VSRAKLPADATTCLSEFNHTPNKLTSPPQDAITNSVELATCYEEGKESKAQSQKENSKSQTMTCATIRVIYP